MTKRLLAIATALAILAVMPATAAAARPTTMTDESVGIFCEGLTPETGDGFAFFSATLSETFGPDGHLDVWTTSSPSGPPALSRDFDHPVDVTWDGSVLAGSIPLRDSDGDPVAAPATFSVTLTPSGDPVPFEDVFKDGNRRVRLDGVTQPMDPDGALSVGGVTFDLGACFADASTFRSFETNPDAVVRHYSQRSVGCELGNGTGESGYLFANLEGEGDEIFIDAGATSADGATDIAGFGFGLLADGVVDMGLETYDPATGEALPVGGSVHLEIVGTGEPFDYILRNSANRVVSRGVTLDIEGTLTLGGMTFDLGDCVGVDGETKEILTSPNGPKPGGKVPANDLPSGARLLGVGSKTSLMTKGASPEFEEPFECLTFEDVNEIFEVPVGHTVWYRIVGTGGPVTIDTAGSDYDTVVAVYTADGAGGYLPVPGACVDDVPLDPIGRTLQAAVTFDTVAGTTYYVQIGGFPESQPYGNLRVAVR